MALKAVSTRAFATQKPSSNSPLLGLDLHLIERISRPDYNTLKYEATIDDPKTYTKPWTGGWTIPWHPDEDFPEYFCQDNNRDAEHLVGQ